MARHIFTRPAAAGLLVVLGLALAPSHAGPGAGDPAKAPDRTADQDAVKARTRTLLEALGKGNAKELAAFWTPTGEYHREELNLRGRANIEKAYAEALKTKSPRALVVQGDAVRFLSDDAAIHEGTFLDKRANPADRHRSRFSILYLRGKGQWQIGLLRETPLGPSPQELGWLVGAWTCQTKGGTVRLVFEWSEGKAFLRGKSTVKSADDTSTGFQVIGLDPGSGALKSWTFEEDGGLGQGTWERTAKGWTAKVTGFNGEGEKVTATTTLTPLDEDTFTWHSTDRTVDGEKAADIGPIQVVREKTKK